jgi:ABC-type oligopeptide transport system substrate-binding subunit
MVRTAVAEPAKDEERIMRQLIIAVALALAPLSAKAEGQPPTSSPLSQAPSDALPVAHLSKVDVYDASNAKVGLIEEVLVGQDGKVVAYILNVGEWYGGLGKYIAVPFQAMEIKKKDDSTWAVLFMTKDAVQSAPEQRFDQHQRKWVPYQPR